MSEPFLGEIRNFAFGFAPKGWAQCNGQLMAINQNQALFALLGTTYGGDGQTTFALPDLRGRVPFHFSNSLTQGQVGGEAGVTLTAAQLGGHSHPAIASSNAATASDPSNAYWAQGGGPGYAPNANATMAPAAVAMAGGGQPHNNLSPYLVVNFCIALQGIFPSRN